MLSPRFLSQSQFYTQSAVRRQHSAIHILYWRVFNFSQKSRDFAHFYILGLITNLDTGAATQSSLRDLYEN